MQLVLRICIFLSFCLVWLKAWTAPPPVWPQEWIVSTNITRFVSDSKTATDYATQIYSWSNKAQNVLHSDMFSFSSNPRGPGTLMWKDDVCYEVWNNFNDCCVFDNFAMEMPSFNWTDVLSYDFNETYNGIPSYRYSNPDVMNVIYWQSIESGLPVAWYNIPNPDEDPYPIIQYFFQAVVYEEALPAEYFTLPSSCSSATSCAVIDPPVTSCDSSSSDVELSLGAFAGVVVALLFVGGFLALGIQYFPTAVVGRKNGGDTTGGGSDAIQLVESGKHRGSHL